MKRQSAPRAASQTARGSLCHNSSAVRPAATMIRTMRATAPRRVAVVIFCCRVLVSASIVATCTGIVAVIIAGPWALAYLPLYLVATLPGWPLGRALFGRHPAAWVAGALLGYGLTCIAFWAVLAMRIPSAITVVLAWALMSGASWMLTSAFSRSPLRRTSPSRGPLLTLPPWSATDSRALILLLLLVPAVFVLPY